MSEIRVDKTEVQKKSVQTPQNKTAKKAEHPNSIMKADKTKEAKQATKVEEDDYEKEYQMKVQKRIEKSKAAIAEAISYGYGEKYNFKIDKETGFVIITLKEDKKLYKIKDDFNLPNGSLLSTNGGKYKPVIIRNEYGDPVESYDNVTAKKGDALLINVDDFKPEKSLWQSIKDLF